MEGDTCREAGGTLPTVGFRRSTRSRTSSFDGTPAIPEIMPASPPKHIHGGSRTDFSAAGRLGTCQYVLSPSWPGRGLRRTTLCVASFLALIGLYSIRSFRPWLPDGELPARGIGKALGDEITGLAARAALEGGTGLHRGVSKARILFDRGLFHGHGTSSSETVQGSSSTRYTVSVKRRQGNQIYVPCGIKFKSPKKPQEMMTHSEFFDRYKDVHQAEANRFNITKIAGKGSYGIVAEAVDTLTGEVVAIKKMIDVFMRRSDALRNLRELKLLRMMKASEDIVQIKHVLLPSSATTYNTVFFVMEKMEQDMRELVRLSRYLPDETHQVVLYQMLRGMHYMHSAHVYHRDVKPSNILINSDCKVKLCDFSLARPVFNRSEVLQSEWTGYVATRWYRPPEMCLAKFTTWAQAMDTWGIGCVFMEALLGQPLFPGNNAEEQLSLITDLLGTPPPLVLGKMLTEQRPQRLQYPRQVQEFFLEMEARPPRNLSSVFPDLPAGVLAIARRMLDLDPETRPTPLQLLNDPFFADMHSDRKLADSPRFASELHDMSFSDRKKVLSMDDLRQLLYSEAFVNYHRGTRSSAWLRTPSLRGPAVPGSRAQIRVARKQFSVRRHGESDRLE